MEVTSGRTLGKLCSLSCQTGTLFLWEEGRGRYFQLLRYCLHKYPSSAPLPFTTAKQLSERDPWPGAASSSHSSRKKLDMEKCDHFPGGFTQTAFMARFLPKPVPLQPVA